ncbi:unnamed protein product [Candida parapsilosis]|uniref:XLF-like N-terminal domain-containing protein n=1 Tax=Candida parapsilosis (strain CDC 317 / ATCC MYA-4646) TaxID=578454 RepID=G8B920_CANPC|nr:uncharacterized protein CPAR2_301080 [Candida parapsilosis]CCE41119.1 hypothetical protein CPAR2_301080 [Candida parapsilosis]
MYELPTQWHYKAIEFVQPCDCIYGIVYDCTQLTCGFYFSNFETVWMEELDKQSLSKKASDLGIDSLSDEKLVLVLDTLAKNIPQKITFVDGPSLIAQFNLDFTWKFELKKQQPEVTIEFLCKLNFQQFANTSYLSYEIEQLKSISEAKESYAKFLELNFKQTHGEQLIKQYKKNNKEVLHLIGDFDQKRWEKKVREDYKRHRLQDLDSVKHDIEIAITTTWVANTKDKTPLTKDKTPLTEDGSQLPVQKLPQPTKKAPIGMLVNPSKRSQSTNSSRNESPKRKKIGQL